MTKRIFIDTDMGSDCDDVAAVAILSHYHRIGKIELLGVTHTSSDKRAVEYLDMVCRFYGFETQSLACAEQGEGIGEFREGFFDDALRGFSYAKPKHDLNAVQLMRKQLSSTKNATILCIGPLNNMSKFISSEPDRFSPLSGREILAQNVAEVVVMGGIFGGKQYDFYGERFDVEYNIRLDASASKSFISNCPSPITFVEFELGYKVKTFAQTVASQKQTPIKRAYELFGVKDRESWDIVAALYSLFGENGYYKKSAEGKCSVDGGGRTTFDEQKDGKHGYLIEAASKAKIEEYVHKIELEIL